MKRQNTTTIIQIVEEKRTKQKTISSNQIHLVFEVDFSMVMGYVSIMGTIFMVEWTLRRKKKYVAVVVAETTNFIDLQPNMVLSQWMNIHIPSSG